MSGQMRWSGDEDGKAHLDDGILLACIRQQSLGTNEPDIHQHIADCAECQGRYNELRQTSIMLDDTLQRNSLPLLKKGAEWSWLQSPEAARLAYQLRQHERLHEDLALGIALLTHLLRVLRILLVQAVSALLPYMRKLKLVPQRRTHRGMAIIPLSLSGVFAATFLMLALTAIVVLAALNGHNLFQPTHLPRGITTAGTQQTIAVSSHLTATPTAGPQSGSGATLTPGVPLPTIFECNDKITHHFSICGKNFKPGTRLELVIQFGDGSFKTRHLGKVDASGTFQDGWSISSCKDAPITISANMMHSSVNLAVLQDIQYGKCSTNLLQRAGTNHH
ncbi:MAG: hypothetical protein ACR2H5_03700 [Ktedonobacteraceae bacterium]